MDGRGVVGLGALLSFGCSSQGLALWARTGRRRGWSHIILDSRNGASASTAPITMDPRARSTAPWTPARWESSPGCRRSVSFPRIFGLCIIEGPASGRSSPRVEPWQVVARGGTGIHRTSVLLDDPRRFAARYPARRSTVPQQFGRASRTATRPGGPSWVVVARREIDHDRTVIADAVEIGIGMVLAGAERSAGVLCTVCAGPRSVLGIGDLGQPSGPHQVEARRLPPTVAAAAVPVGGAASYRLPESKARGGQGVSQGLQLLGRGSLGAAGHVEVAHHQHVVLAAGP